MIYEYSNKSYNDELDSFLVSLAFEMLLEPLVASVQVRNHKLTLTLSHVRFTRTAPGFREVHLLASHLVCVGTGVLLSGL